MINKYDQQILQGNSYLPLAILFPFTTLQLYHPTHVNPLSSIRLVTPRSRKIQRAISISKFFSAERLLNSKATPQKMRGGITEKPLYSQTRGLHCPTQQGFLVPSAPVVLRKASRDQKINITDINQAQTPVFIVLQEVRFQTGNQLRNIPPHEQLCKTQTVPHSYICQKLR